MYSVITIHYISTRYSLLMDTEVDRLAGEGVCVINYICPLTSLASLGSWRQFCLFIFMSTTSFKVHADAGQSEINSLRRYESWTSHRHHCTYEISPIYTKSHHWLRPSPTLPFTFTEQNPGRDWLSADTPPTILLPHPASQPRRWGGAPITGQGGKVNYQLLPRLLYPPGCAINMIFEFMTVI